MQDTTKKFIKEKVDSVILQMQTNGVALTPKEELLYRQGIAMGVSMSVLFFNDFSMEDIMESCGLNNLKNEEE